MNLRKIETILVTLGTFIFCASLYLFLFQADHLSLWLGIPLEKNREPVGRIEYLNNMARRKLIDGSEFLPLAQSQAIFSRDSVMTGNQSSLKLLLNDGSVLELGPDTLIEVKFKDNGAGFGNSEFVITVNQGAVKPLQSSPRGKVTVLQKPRSFEGEDGSISALPLASSPIAVPSSTPEQLTAASVTPSPTVAPSPTVVLATPTATPEREYCKLLNERVIMGLPEKLPTFEGEIQCPRELLFALAVRNESGEALPLPALQVGSNRSASFSLTLPAPGKYSYSSEDLKDAGTVTVEKGVPSPLAEKWVVTCDRSITLTQNRAYQTMSGKVSLFNASGEEVMEAKLWRGLQRLGPLPKTFSLPAEARLLLITQRGFELNQTISLPKARDCLVLSSPLQNAKLKFTANKPTLFTWHLNQNASYRFQVAEDRAFAKVIKSEQTKLNFGLAQLNHAGKYYWRISADSGETSEVIAFEVK